MALLEGVWGRMRKTGCGGEGTDSKQAGGGRAGDGVDDVEEDPASPLPVRLGPYASNQSD